MKFKKEIIDASKYLLQLQFNIGSEGNISCRQKNEIYISPSGIKTSNLKPNDISKVDLNGKVLNGIKPSSEILLNNETISNFRKNFLRSFGVNYIDSPLYKSIIEGKKFHGYEHLAPLFFGNMNLMYDFLG